MIGTPTIYFDIDGTLLLWEQNGIRTCDTQSEYSIKAICYGKEYHLIPHQKHIELLKQHKNEGFKIVVWSAGGQVWAEEAVKVLGLQGWVDHCLSKPSFFYDDLPTDYFMHFTKKLWYKDE